MYSGWQKPYPFLVNDNFLLIFNQISWARECGGIYSGPTGTISSPGFPDRYDDNLTCTYVINATSESYVLLSFEDPFELEGNLKSTKFGSFLIVTKKKKRSFCTCKFLIHVSFQSSYFWAVILGHGRIWILL